MLHFLDEDFSSLNRYIQQNEPSKIFILVDENTHTHCLPTLLGNLQTTAPFEILEIEQGEEMKNLQTANSLWEILIEYQADRKALLINLGGGVITDLGGFVASTYKRGIDFIHIPTSLLAMVDAAIGGKNGIDLGAMKNIIGTFTIPKGIFIYPQFLKTLPEEQVFSGLAEMIKHGLVADAQHWQKLIELNEISAETLAEFIVPSIKIKKNITDIDPNEANIRKILNFGHTFGHAIESWHLANGNPILHGFAVAMGMFIESQIAYRLGAISLENYQNIEKNLIRIYPFCAEISYSIADLLPYMKNDKKNEEEGIGFVILTDIGQANPHCFLKENELYEIFS